MAFLDINLSFLFLTKIKGELQYLLKNILLFEFDFHLLLYIMFSFFSAGFHFQPLNNYL